MKYAAAARALLLLLAGFTIACEKPEQVPPDPRERAAAAAAAYDPALFDTVTWSSPDERLLEGNQIYGAHCRRCHGPFGTGETEYAEERRLEVPSLVDPDWEYGGDVVAIRRRIFVGHPPGMPVWGIGGISPREIDAVAQYILEQLRAPTTSGAASSSS